MQEKRQGFSRLIIASSLIALAPFLILAFYNHPSSDDYICTVPAMQWDPITVTLGWYYSWSSRYTAAFLLSINPLVYRWILGYQLNTWLLIGLLFAGFFFFFRATCNLKFKTEIIGLALLSVSVYACSVYSVVEAFYYFAGALCYQPANALLLIICAFWFNKLPIASVKDNSFSSILILGIQGFILVLISGSNEMVMFFSLAIVGCFWLFKCIEQKSIHFGLTFLLSCSLFSTLIVLIAPATKYRMEANGAFKRTWSDVIDNSILSYIDNMYAWFTTASFLFLILTIIWIPVSNKLRILTFSQLLLLSFLSILLTFLCFIPSFLGEGILQNRTANALLFNVLFLFMINVVFWKRYIFQIQTQYEHQNFSIGLKILMIGTAISLFFSGNFQQAFADLYTGDAAAFNQERLDRIRILQLTKGDSVWVPPLRHKPKTINYGDIGMFPDPWYDNVYAQYYGKKFIHLDTGIYKNHKMPQTK